MTKIRIKLNSPFKIVELATHYMDFCTAKFEQLSLDSLKLLGIVCFMLACKQEDYNSQSVTIQMAAEKSAFDEAVVRDTEMLVLDTLSWELDILVPSEICIGLLKTFLQQKFTMEFPSKLCDYAWEFSMSTLYIKDSLLGSNLEVGCAISIATFDILDSSKVIDYLSWLSELYTFNWVG